jgi:Xaa-Pro aminopeptidase
MQSQQYDWPVDPSRFEYTRVSDAEFERRHRLVRDFLHEEGLDALLVQGSAAIQDRAWTNVRWLTNHAGCQLANAEYAIVPADENEQVTLATLSMYTRVPARRARAAEVIDDLRSSGMRCIGAVIDRLEELGVDGGSVGVVAVDGGLGIHADDRDRLEGAFPQAEFRPVTRKFWGLRMKKSDEGIEMIERSAKIGDRVMETLAERVEPGMTESHVFGVAAEAMAEHGGELPTMILVASTDTYDSDDSKQRMRPVNRTLSTGDTLIHEHAPRYPDGSESQIGRPTFLGEPSEEYQEMTELMMEVYEDLLDAIRPGNTGQDLSDACKPIEEAGYYHGSPAAHAEIGGGVSARPLIGIGGGDSSAGSLGDDDVVLEENMVLVPEPAVHTSDGTKGVFTCDTVVVTNDGYRRLNEFPLDPLYL